LEKYKRLKVDNSANIRYLNKNEETRLRKALDERESRIRRNRDNGNKWRKVRDIEPLPSLQTNTYVDHLKPMVILAINTGLRRGELFSLTWQDVNLTNNDITVTGSTTKTGTTRHIPLNTEALKALSKWKRQANNETGLVFTSKGNKRFDNVRKSWGKLLKDAKIVNFRWHDLRHHFASKLVMAGVDLNTVRELLGHTDINMTLRYAHLAPEHKAAAVAKLVEV
jgi:integrase